MHERITLGKRLYRLLFGNKKQLENFFVGQSVIFV
nr:hypothetical protein [Bacillus wudalianchiensis]